MPIYEYRCSACGHRFEVSQKMTDAPLTECEVCGGEVAKVLFAPAIHFKGTGFHNTDYGTRRRSAAGEDGGAGDGASSNGASPDGAGGASEKAGGGEKAGASAGTTVGLDKV